MQPNYFDSRMFALFVIFISAVCAQVFACCRCFPGDSCWPSEDGWAKFNQSIDGMLVTTVPLGTPCHAPSYNATECTALRDIWRMPQEHYESSSSVMAPFFANGSCDPYHPVSQPCTLGNYVAYAVNVTKPEHVSKAIQFATKHNIRVVVRNTGHDYNGKSTGAGALGIWTHHLKEIHIHDYEDPYYIGKAITMGAGVQGFEAFEAAEQAGVQVVGGECPTVGLAGGYSQGGGHSALSSRYGLGADQVLKWEVVDGEGNSISATRDNAYSDLWWALSGGGGGTYGVVVSMTSKAYRGTPVSGFNLTFTNEEISQDTFYEAIERFHEYLSAIVDEGAMAIWIYTNTSFAISPMTGPDIPVAKLLSLVQPFVKDLKELGIKHTMFSAEFPSYLSEFSAMQQEIGVGDMQYGAWLIPRSVVQKNNRDLTTGTRQITEDGATFIGVGLNVSQEVIGNVKNSVLPAWREALISVTLGTPWKWNADSEMLAAQQKMTDEYIPKLMAVAPDSGVYMNEADLHQPDFEKYFFGSNYPKLKAIKRKYDPNDIFYARTAVGSGSWEERVGGRLCRAAQCLSCLDHRDL